MILKLVRNKKDLREAISDYYNNKAMKITLKQCIFQNKKKNQNFQRRR